MCDFYHQSTRLWHVLAKDQAVFSTQSFILYSADTEHLMHILASTRFLSV